MSKTKEVEESKFKLHNDAVAGALVIDGKMTSEIAKIYGLKPKHVLEVLLPLWGKENQSGSTLSATMLRFQNGEWRPDERALEPGKAYLHYYFFYT